MWGGKSVCMCICVCVGGGMFMCACVRRSVCVCGRLGARGGDGKEAK